MVATSLLMQTASFGGVNMSTVNVVIALSVFVYLIYAVYYKKNSDLKEAVSGFKGLIPVVLLGIMSIIPATGMAIFGIGAGSAFLMLLFTIFTAGLYGYFLGYIALRVIDVFDPTTIN